MLDIRFIRENRELVEKSSHAKGYKVDVQKLLDVDDNRKILIAEIERIRSEKNALAKLNDGMPVSRAEFSPSHNPAKIQKGRELKVSEAKIEAQFGPVSLEFDKLLREIPNVIPDDTPLGGEEDNVEVKKWGDADAKDVKDHLTWGEERGLIDFERGAKVAGAKFYFLKGALVELELAVTLLGMELAKKHAFTPMMVPHLVNTRILEGAGFSARGEEKQIYKIEAEDLNLIATAEIPLTGFHADEILNLNELPYCYAGLSPAYRVEGGAYGKHNRGLFRTHQFNKLELYVYCRPEDSEEWHQKMVALEEEFCQKLEIPYRVVRIAAGDLGAPAYKKFDIEYWSPADKIYRELMSCSNVTDYQARRLNIRYKNDEGQSEFVHTLNGTLAAMSRIPIAIIENFQDKDGNVHVPPALQKYMNGQSHL
jgi:seryl-tRNA synthetase